MNQDAFTAAERVILQRYFTSVDGPVFALQNLPEVVKGALFARYSRSPKSLRRLFLDEFAADVAAAGPPAPAPDPGRAEALYQRVFADYGDDSVAQLGSAHLAVEGASNVLTKILERGRLMSYLEQSTRYIPYTDRPAGRWRYHRPAELEGALAERFDAVMDQLFALYTEMVEPLQEWFRFREPPADGTGSAAYRAAIRARALDTVRGLLPAATTSNVGIHGTGQAFEQLLLRMRASPLAEARQTAQLMLVELRKVIPAFLTRVDREDRGDLWAAYLAETRAAVAGEAARLEAHTRWPLSTPDQDRVQLTDWDPDGELKVAAAALYPHLDIADDALLEAVRRVGPEGRSRIIAAATGVRRNRRHRPGRAFERAWYRFDIEADYGAFRDLQRHRMLTVEWQRLTPRLGYTLPEPVEGLGFGERWRAAMDASARLHAAVQEACGPDVAQYAVCLAYRVRFSMTMNAREAMHVIELRSAPQGHEAYRRVAQAMLALIRERAGHQAIAGAMQFANQDDVVLGRLEAEERAERRRSAAG